ncbi:MAG: hypothetical protein HN531_10155 [Opitutae bacterium]|nr:hypothetical protein [Opitutae bacterium]
MREAVRAKGSGWEIWIASLGCLLGSSLLILAVQLYQDSNRFFDEQVSPSNFFTLNKKIQGGALVNLGKGEKTFTQEELDQIEKMEGVMRTGGFTRNKFPLTLYIWPSGKVGLGAAAKTDLFFESIPDEFLDFVPEEWEWDENSSTVPIIVPKFYLDLWNFGLAPSRVEYPTLSNEAATGMPIELFIGNNREVTLEGRFVAFSKRINSVLVPESFLSQANEKYGKPDAGQYFFLWKDGAVDGPPRTLEFLQDLTEEQKQNGEVSPIGSPAEKKPILEILEAQTSDTHLPSRIIVQIEGSPSDAFVAELEAKGYEINREFPEQDLVKKITNAVFLGMAIIGVLFSISSIATFATSFRLVVTQASEPATNLLLLGFSSESLTKLFFRRFVLIFMPVFLAALAAGFGLQNQLCSLAKEVGMELESGLSAWTLAFGLVYCILFLVINRKTIEKSVDNLAK